MDCMMTYLCIWGFLWDHRDVPLLCGWFPLSSELQYLISKQWKGERDKGSYCMMDRYQVWASHILLVLLIFFVKLVFEGSHALFLLSFGICLLNLYSHGSGGGSLLVLLDLCWTATFPVVEELVCCLAVCNSIVLGVVGHSRVNVGGGNG